MNSVHIANAVFDAQHRLGEKLDAIIALLALSIDHLERISEAAEAKRNDEA